MEASNIITINVSVIVIEKMKIFFQRFEQPWQHKSGTHYILLRFITTHIAVLQTYYHIYIEIRFNSALIELVFYI